MEGFIDGIMQNLAHGWHDLFTPAGFAMLVNVIMIDIVMSADNAILIGLATQRLAAKDKKKAIIFGIAGATVLRIILSVIALQLLEITGLILLGGLLLAYVVFKFYQELRVGGEEHHGGAKAPATLGAALWTIIIADLSMSLDNVLGVAGAAHGNFLVLVIGLLVSILLMAFAATAMANILTKYPAISWIGLMMIFFVAMEMILEGTGDVSKLTFGANIFPLIFGILAIGLYVLQERFTPPAAQKKIETFVLTKSPVIIFALVGILLVNTFAHNSIAHFLNEHPAVNYSLLFMLIFASIEAMRVLINTRKAK